MSVGELGSKTCHVAFHVIYLPRKVSVAQKGGRVRELKPSLSWSDEIRHPWICFYSHHLLSLSTNKP